MALAGAAVLQVGWGSAAAVVGLEGDPWMPGKIRLKTESVFRCMLENWVGDTKAEGRNMTFGG